MKFTTQIGTFEGTTEELVLLYHSLEPKNTLLSAVEHQNDLREVRHYRKKNGNNGNGHAEEPDQESLDEIKFLKDVSREKAIPMWLASYAYNRKLHLRFESKDSALCGLLPDGSYSDDANEATTACGRCIRAIKRMEREAEQIANGAS